MWQNLQGVHHLLHLKCLLFYSPVPNWTNFLNPKFVTQLISQDWFQFCLDKLNNPGEWIRLLLPSGSHLEFRCIFFSKITSETNVSWETPFRRLPDIKDSYQSISEQDFYQWLKLDVAIFLLHVDAIQEIAYSFIFIWHISIAASKRHNLI